MFNVLDDIASLIDMMEQGVLPDLQGNPVKVTQEQIAQMKRALHKDMWKGKVPVHPIPGISAPPTRQAGLAAAPIDMGQKHGSEDKDRDSQPQYNPETQTTVTKKKKTEATTAIIKTVMVAISVSFFVAHVTLFISCLTCLTNWAGLVLDIS